MNKRTCTIEDCGNKVVARGWCNRHYLRWSHHGDPLGGGRDLKPSQDHNDGTRTCNGCGDRLPLTDFDHDETAAHGRRSQCSPCRGAKVKQWYQDNQERQLERARARQSRDGDKIRAGDMLRYERNREARIALATVHGHLRRSRLAEAVTERGISVKALRAIHGDICPYCKVGMTFLAGRGHEYTPGKATVEHIVPLSRGGDHTFANTMLCCWRCNIRKNAKPLEEWIAYGRETLRQDRTEAVDQAS